jgi:hypothetical protein
MEAYEWLKGWKGDKSQMTDGGEKMMAITDCHPSTIIRHPTLRWMKKWYGS